MLLTHHVAPSYHELACSYKNVSRYSLKLTRTGQDPRSQATGLGFGLEVAEFILLDVRTVVKGGFLAETQGSSFGSDL